MKILKYYLKLVRKDKLMMKEAILKTSNYFKMSNNDVINVIRKNYLYLTSSNIKAPKWFGDWKITSMWIPMLNVEQTWRIETLTGLKSRNIDGFVNEDDEDICLYFHRKGEYFDHDCFQFQDGSGTDLFTPLYWLPKLIEILEEK